MHSVCSVGLSLLVLGATLILWSAPADAHHLELSRLELRTARSASIQGRFRLAPNLLEPEDRALPVDLAGAKLLSKLQTGFILRVNGRNCPPQFEIVELWQNDSASPGDLVDLSCALAGQAPQPVLDSGASPNEHSVQIRWLVEGRELLLTYPEASAEGRIEESSSLLRSGDERTFQLADSKQQIASELSPPTLPTPSDANRPSTARSKLERSTQAANHSKFSGADVREMSVLGFEHVLPDGWDHVLFMMLLSWGNYAERKRLVQQLSIFTLAHGIALFLAVTGLVKISALLVEPAILLSIVALAVERAWCALRRKNANEGPTNVRFGMWTIGGFGLIHGLGFGSAFAELGIPNAKLLPSLLAFHVGIELGQLLVVTATCAVCLTIAYLVSRRSKAATTA